MDKPHKNLNVWEKAVELSILVYEITESFPKSEIYGLSSQMRRAAVSVPSNTCPVKFFLKDERSVFNWGLPCLPS